MVYGDFKDLPRRTASNKYYIIKHLILLKTQNMMGIKRAWLPCSNGLQIMLNSGLAEESHKPIIRNFEKWKVR